MFDPYRKWLGIPPEEQPPNHYRLLGISLFENDLDVIKVAVMQRSAYVRNFQAGKQGDDAARILNEIAAAESCLTTPAKRGPYDAELKRKEAAKKPRPAPAARPSAPKVDPLLEQAAAMTTLSAPWQSPQFSQRAKQTNYLPLAIGGVVVVIVVILGMVLASMLGGDGDGAVAEGDAGANASDDSTDTAGEGAAGSAGERSSAAAEEATPNSTAVPQTDSATVVTATDNATAATAENSRAVPAPPPAIAPFNAAQARAHQEAWAAHLGVPVQYENSIGMKFVLIPPGEFTMGSTLEEIEAAVVAAGGFEYWKEHIRSEAPQHKVVLTSPIYLGVHEVTQAEYELVMGNNPSHFAATGPGKDAVAGLDTSSHSVEMVSWNDAAEFCAKLSQSETRKPFYLRSGETVTTLGGAGYRLPTEAEWEFACRAGTTTKFSTGDREDSLPRAAWLVPSSGGRTHAVGELTPNPFGLFDVHGNAWEWVQDRWEPDYYAQFQESPALDPNGPSSTTSERAMRGGSWQVLAFLCRSSHRNGDEQPRNYIGFRVALSAGAEAVGSPPVELTGTERSQPDSAADDLPEVELPVVVEDFALATAQMADLANWTVRSGEWSAEDGGIVGRGGGMLLFKQLFPQDFLLEMTATIRAGVRLRMHLGGSDLFIGDEGFSQSLWLHGTGYADLQGQPLVYQHNRPLKIAIKFHGPNLTFTVNGQSVATARRTKIGTVHLELQPGDGYSAGDVLFRDFRLGPPPLTPDEAMAAIRAAGGSIEPYRHQGQPALKVVMTGRGITDEVVANVRWLPDTREIFLGGSNISDAGMVHLAELQRLEVLGLDDTPISDAGVAHLVGLPRLSVINVGWSSGRSAITDAGAEHLSKLTRLTSLGLSHTQLTDAGLKHLAKLTRLEALFLNGIALSDAAVAELKRKLPKANIVR